MATKREEKSNRLTALAENLVDAACTPFLGSGASAPYIPTGAALAEDWARRFRYPFPDTWNLGRVMQYVAFKESLDAPTLKQRVINEHFSNAPSPVFSAPCQVHKVLADCKLPLYVTTNYDDFMFQALERTPGRRPHRDLSPWYVGVGEEPPPSPLGRRSKYRPSGDQPLVFHLHGHHSVSRSLVLTEDDNIDYLVREAGDTRPRGDLPQVLPDYVRGRLRETSLLFLGYGLQDWTFHVLFRRLLYGAAGKRNHVSVQRDPSHSAPPRAREYVEHNLGLQKIWIFWENTESFMDKLVKRLTDVRHKRRGGMP